MRKILAVLFGVLFVQNAYSDSLQESSLWSDIGDYLDDRMDDDAIRELCKGLLNYAWMHNFNILLETGTEGRYFTPTTSDCKSSNMQYVMSILQKTAVQLVREKFDEHSQCTQNVMKQKALLGCGGHRSAQVSFYESQGFTFDFSADKAVVSCSKTDNRCVVNRPVSRNGYPAFYSVCCSVPVSSCTETSHGINAQVEAVSILDIDIARQALTVDDYDLACKPLGE